MKGIQGKLAAIMFGVGLIQADGDERVQLHSKIK